VLLIRRRRRANGRAIELTSCYGEGDRWVARDTGAGGRAAGCWRTWPEGRGQRSIANET